MKIQLGGVLLAFAPAYQGVTPIVRTGHSVPLIKGIFSTSGFCNRVLWEKVISPQPNSKPGGPKSSLYPLTCLAWVTLPGVKDSSQHSSMDQQDTQLNHSTTVR